MHCDWARLQFQWDPGVRACSHSAECGLTPLNDYYVLCNGVESGFMAYACRTSPDPPLAVTVWLGTTELTNLWLPSHLDAWPGPLFRALNSKACLAAGLGFKEIHVDAQACQCNVMAARGAGCPASVLLVLPVRLVTNLLSPSPSQPEVPKQYTYTTTTFRLASMLVLH